MRSFFSLAVLVTLLAIPARAADTLTVQQAVAQGLAQHPALRASAAAGKVATARIAEARGAYLPRADYLESWTRSNNPVFVFGSLLDQRRFAASNFALDFLNNPSFTNNFQSQVTVEETLFDGGRRGSQTRAAELGSKVVQEDQRGTKMRVVGAVLRAYYTALLSQEELRVAGEAVRSAEADLQRAEARLAAGIATEADRLSLRVHLAAMRERQIRARAAVDLGVVELNAAMGVDLDRQFDLTTPLRPSEGAAPESKQVEQDALANSPANRQAQLATSIRGEQEKTSRAAMLPEMYIRAGFEADRGNFASQGGANWMAGAGLRWNLFHGFSDRARQDAARYETERSRAGETQVRTATILEARGAWLELQSAAQRIEVAKAAVAMASESLRIVRNRYEAGLAEVTELLRAETALLETQSRDLTAVRDQRLAAVRVEEVRGTLSEDSEVVRK